MLEVIDQDNFTVGEVSLNVFQLNISQGKKISLPLALDSFSIGMNIEVDAFVDITNLQYAQKDFGEVTKQQGLLKLDLIDIQLQLRDINSPFFEGVNRSFRQGSHKPFLYKYPLQAVGIVGQNNQRTPFYIEDEYRTAEVRTKFKNVQRGIKDTANTQKDNHHSYKSNKEECSIKPKPLILQNVKRNNNRKRQNKNILCPISQESMKDPYIITVCGHSFEKQSIEQSLKFQQRCPICRKECTQKDLIPNYTLKDMIDDYFRNNN